MDYLENKFIDLQKALVAFEEALNGSKTVINRDASLKRFEFTFELLWKNIKLYLKEIEKVDCFSPGSCFREMRANLDLEESIVETCLKMSGDRNISVHTYSEKMADELHERLPQYLDVMKLIAKKIKEKANL